MPSRRDNRQVMGTARRRRPMEAAAAAGALVVIAAAGIVGTAAFDTASGRISGSTGNSSNLFEAGRIELALGNETSLLFDADGLFPGLELERCVEVEYIGSIDDVDIRLSASRSGGDGLEAFVETSITTGTGSDPECGDFVRRSGLFEGRLGDVWASHPDFERGLTIGDAIESGFATTVRVTAEIVDDNAAQSLTTDFWMTLEARP